MLLVIISAVQEPAASAVDSSAPCHHRGRRSPGAERRRPHGRGDGAVLRAAWQGSPPKRGCRSQVRIAVDKQRKQAENNLDLWCGDAASQATVKPSVVLCLQTCVSCPMMQTQPNIRVCTTLSVDVVPWIRIRSITTLLLPFAQSPVL